MIKGTWALPTLDSDDVNVDSEHISKVCACRRRVFTTEEDKFLAELVQSQKCTNWFEVAQKLPGRTARQCRDRWMNYLSPSNSFAPWSREEDEMIVEKVNEFGTRWSAIAKLIEGRSDNTIKNRWYSGLKKNCSMDDKGKYVLRGEKKTNSVSLSSPSSSSSPQQTDSPAIKSSVAARNRSRINRTKNLIAARRKASAAAAAANAAAAAAAATSIPSPIPIIQEEEEVVEEDVSIPMDSFLFISPSFPTCYNNGLNNATSTPTNIQNPLVIPASPYLLPSCQQQKQQSNNAYCANTMMQTAVFPQQPLYQAKHLPTPQLAVPQLQSSQQQNYFFQSENPLQPLQPQVFLNEFKTDEDDDDKQQQLYSSVVASKTPEQQNEEEYENDFWDRHLFNQVTEMNQDPFQISELYGEWF